MSVDQLDLLVQLDLVAQLALLENQDHVVSLAMLELLDLQDQLDQEVSMMPNFSNVQMDPQDQI